ncbi:hypothetical protein F3J02_01465 [Acinetobacter sp. Tr-809]|nr:hypothetical protein [Acinetobacter sp. Tr-809]
MRSETKIFNEWYFKKYGGIISIGTMTGAVLKSWVRKGFDAGWQHRQTEVDELKLEYSKAKLSDIRHASLARDVIFERDELQKRVDVAHDTLTELKEKSEALHHRWNILSDYVALAEAEMIDMCVKELEQALKGGGE